MKKNKTKKRLPRYVLGTMKPIDLGYQKARGIGGFNAYVEPESTEARDEANAIRQSIVPNAINKGLQYGYQGYQTYNAFKNPTRATNIATTTGTSALSTAAQSAQTLSPYIAAPITNTPTIPMYNWAANSAYTPSLSSRITTAGGQQALSNSIANVSSTIPQGGLQLSDKAMGAVNQQIAEQVGSNAGKTALNAAGKVAGIAGTALGAYNIFNDISSFGDHRSTSDMFRTSGRQYYTTDQGNQYNAYTGVNEGNEVKYYKADRDAKTTNLVVDAAGTGFSAGMLTGNPLIALGTGLLGGIFGGLGSALGLWGGPDEEEIREQVRRINDNIANYNRQQESIAKSKDVAAEFNNRIGYAKCGKASGGSMKKYSNGKESIETLQGPNGYAIGKPTSMLAPGEYTYDPVNMTGNKVTGKGHDDTVPSYIEPHDQNIVFSDVLKIGNKSIAKHAAPMINEIEKLNKIIAQASQTEELQEGQQQLQISQAKQRQQELNEQLVQLSELQNVQRDMKQYKCGKKPGYLPGKEAWMDYALPAMAHLTSMMQSRQDAKRAKNAHLPDYPNIVDSGANTKALDILASRRFNVDPIVDRIHGTYRQSLYDINRTPGLGAGGQAVARANAAVQTNKQIADVMTQADEINNKYVADYAGALSNYGKWLSEMMTNNNYARANYRAQQNAAQQYYIDTANKNYLTAFGDLASDVLKTNQFHRSQDYQNEMLRLYGRQIDNDELAAMYNIYNQAEANRFSKEKAVAESNLSKLIGKTLGAQTDSYKNPIYPTIGIPESAWRLNFGNLIHLKCGKSAYKDGKNVVYRNKIVQDRSELIQPKNILGIGDWSAKVITADGDTIYRDPTAGNVFFGNPTQVIRHQGGEATPEYLKAKARHEQLLNNATLAEELTPWQTLKGLFGFKCGKSAYKCGKSGKRKRC